MSAIYDALHRTRYRPRAAAARPCADHAPAAITPRPRRRRPDAAPFLRLTTLALIAAAALQALTWVISLATLQMPEPPARASNLSRLFRPAPDRESLPGSVVPAVHERGFTVTSARDARDPAAQNSRGLMLLDDGDAVGAASIFRAVLRTRPDDVGALVNLGIALETAGQTSEARVWLNRAHTLAPGNAAVLYNLATVYDREGSVQPAVEYYRAFLRIASATDPTHSADVRRRLTELDGRPR